MRKLLSLIIVVSVAWAGYWFVGSSGVRKGMQLWFEERRGEGWVADYDTMSVQGFPNRFDTFFTELNLADPGTGWAWNASEFLIAALSYDPSHLIAIWPDQQRIATPFAKFDVTSEDMRASLVLEKAADLPLDRTTVSAQQLAVTDERGDTATLTELILAVERVPTDINSSYRLGLQVEGFSPSLPWKKLIDPTNTLPDSLDAIRADMSVTFDQIWNLDAVNHARPQPRNIRVRLAEARWGKLLLQVAGEVAVDEYGIPTGEITVKARNWREILQLTVNSGAIPEGISGSIENGLTLVASLAGNPETLDVPLTFENGVVKLGPVPLGPAPVLKLR